LLKDKGWSILWIKASPRCDLCVSMPPGASFLVIILLGISPQPPRGRSSPITNTLSRFFGADPMSRLTIDIADQQHQSLKTLLGTRIQEGLAGNVSAKSINEILDEELGEGRD